MRAGSPESRGGPLAMLAVVGIGWVTLRAITWESPFPVEMDAFLPDLPQFVELEQPDPLAQISPVADVGNTVEPVSATAERPSYVVRIPLELKDAEAEPPQFADARAVSGGHQMLWLAAMSQMPVPLGLERQAVTGIGPNALQPEDEPEDGKRWSLDAWALWRQGSGIAQGRRPSYGASQMGAVFNYRLRRSSGHDPRVYVRGYRALVDNAETEIALGLSGRPLPDIPLRAHAEMRATERFDETDYRPSAFVTTELPPQSLPLGTRAEIYGQAGYVWGEFPTYFMDGQVHITREVADFDLATVSVGAAAWGGAQKGAERVDIGPSMRVDLDIGKVPARVAIDYREQVAGDAEPGSGVAVTVSTRF